MTFLLELTDDHLAYHGDQSFRCESIEEAAKQVEEWTGLRLDLLLLDLAEEVGEKEDGSVTYTLESGKVVTVSKLVEAGGMGVGDGLGLLVGGRS